MLALLPGRLLEVKNQRNRIVCSMHLLKAAFMHWCPPNFPAAVHTTREMHHVVTESRGEASVSPGTHVLELQRSVEQERIHCAGMMGSAVRAAGPLLLGLPGGGPSAATDVTRALPRFFPCCEWPRTSLAELIGLQSSQL